MADPRVPGLHSETARAESGCGTVDSAWSVTPPWWRTRPPPSDVLTGPVRSVRDNVPADLRQQHTGLLMRDYPYDSLMAERVLGQGYAYLLTAMAKRGQKLGLAPSKFVDVGVHTIILDPVAYAELCEKYNDGMCGEGSSWWSPKKSVFADRGPAAGPRPEAGYERRQDRMQSVYSLAALVAQAGTGPLVPGNAGSQPAAKAARGELATLEKRAGHSRKRAQSRPVM